MADRFELCAWRVSAERAGVVAGAATLGMQVDRICDLAPDPEAAAVASDWLVSRGCGRDGIAGTSMRWRSAAGPDPMLKLIVALDLRLPDLVACHDLALVDAVVARGHSPALRTPRPFPTGRVTSRTVHGRHALAAWRLARGPIGERLLALAALRHGTLTADPARLAAFDQRLLQLARLEVTATPAAGGTPRAAFLRMAGGLIDGTALQQLWLWLNDARRAADAGLPVDFALPRVLGLHPVSRLSIIP